MKIKVFTLFPEMLRAMLSESILGRAIEAGLIEVALYNIRDYTLDKHRCTDDYPFGGGAGMVMMAQPIIDAIEQNTEQPFRGRRIYLSPRGRRLNQKIVEELAREEELVLLCGHYEGVDQRALDRVIDEELSIGDYVLTGGELGALVVIDSVARLVPGVLGSDESSADESFTTGLLEYPQYTRPADFRGMRAPEVLLGGNHADIADWRREQSLEITLTRRPELLDTAPLTDDDRRRLQRIRRGREVAAMLDECGVGCERLALRLADQWPRRWFAAFVPEDRRREARKQCFSGRRHVGFLWQAFSMNYASALEGEDARRAWRDAADGEGMLCLPDDGLLFRVTGAVPEEGLVRMGYAVLADEAMTRTFVVTGRPDRGPYYAGAGCF